MKRAMRACRQCEKPKPLAEFGVLANGHRRWTCKDCRNAARREAYHRQCSYKPIPGEFIPAPGQTFRAFVRGYRKREHMMSPFRCDKVITEKVPCRVWAGDWRLWHDKFRFEQV